MAYVTESLAWTVNAVLFAAALVALLRWRNRLALVTLLLAADPVWTMLSQAVLEHSVPGVPLFQALYAIAGDAPLWASFIVGFASVFGAAGRRDPV